MADIVNLNRVRKRSARAAAESEAQTNRAKFGRTKAERACDADEAQRAAERVSQHRLDNKET